MTPRWPLEASGASPGTPEGLRRARAILLQRLGSHSDSLLGRSGGSGTLRGGLWEPSGRLFGVPKGVLLIQHGVHQKSDEKVPKCSHHEQIFSIWEVLQKLFSHAMFLHPCLRLRYWETYKIPRKGNRIQAFHRFCFALFSVLPKSQTTLTAIPNSCPRSVLLGLYRSSRNTAKIVPKIESGGSQKSAKSR